ncbi:acyl-homoserine-lactone synthase [Octadecabacter sp. R77987]|uniref:acyl-homoserine-lactone synthase n=1 Tax=Octadecabacter sp. R77987 TaxID=3093874 RepID=UPI00366CED97
MLRYLYADQLKDYPALCASMFRDRADQFARRLGWDVQVDELGWERDDYDALNPLYVIWQRPDGTHGGSMRFLPTTGQTMVRDHFGNLTVGADITSPLIWECTRFCLARGAAPQVAGALMLAGGELMRGFSLTHFVGVFDARMVRIYRMIGSSPTVLGSSGKGRDQISVGLWEYAPDARMRVLRRAGISSALSEHWFARAFGHPPQIARQAA